MPTVKSNERLAEIYWNAKKNINSIPTRPLMPSDTRFYRKIPQGLLVKPPKDQPVPRSACDSLLKPRDGAHDAGNRFSGPPCGDRSRGPCTNMHTIPCASGLYTAMQQQALINEMMHYTGRTGKGALDGQTLVTFGVKAPLLVADLSPHESAAAAFLRRLGVDPDKELLNPVDCSAARAIGIAIANSGMLCGLIARTARKSERSAEERGDNLILFGSNKRPIAGIYVESVQFFNQADKSIEKHTVSQT